MIRFLSRIDSFMYIPLRRELEYLSDARHNLVIIHQHERDPLRSSGLKDFIIGMNFIFVDFIDV